MTVRHCSPITSRTRRRRAYPDPPPQVPVPCRDRDDVVFIQLVLAAKAEFLISGDADLAALAGKLPVASPASLRQALGWHAED